MSQETAGSATASRNDGTQSGAVTGTGSGEGTTSVLNLQDPQLPKGQSVHHQLYIAGTPGSGTSGGTNSTNEGACGSILDVVAGSPELSTLLSLLQVKDLNCNARNTILNL